MPRARNRNITAVEQWHRPFGAIGMILTAFLWLLSEIEPQTEILPTNPAHVIIIMFGFMMSVSMVFVSPLTMVFGLKKDKAQDNRIKDYAIGFVASCIAHGLMAFMFLLSEDDILGTMENKADAIPILILSAIILGWLSVYTERRKQSESHWEDENKHCS